MQGKGRRDQAGPAHEAEDPAWLTGSKGGRSVELVYDAEREGVRVDDPQRCVSEFVAVTKDRAESHETFLTNPIPKR